MVVCLRQRLKHVPKHVTLQGWGAALDAVDAAIYRFLLIPNAPMC